MMKFIIVMFLLVGCVQYFDPSIDQPEDQPIVIDALLTDELKNHQVRLSRTKGIGSSDQFSTIENAEIYIEDSEGERYSYSHIQDGVYLSEDVFAGEKDVGYRIVITIDSDQYISGFESIPEPAELTDLKAEFVLEPTQVEPGIFSDVPQIEFFVDIERNDAEVDSYFRFDWEATYRAETPDQGDTVCWEERDLEAPTDLKPTEVCYVNETSSGFLQILSTEGLAAGNTVNEVSVYSIFPNKRFQFRYSPEVTMYSINKSAFDFWQLIINQNENAGGLFDPALSPINGNILGINESSGRVIGIFEVASVTKRRSFFGSSIVEVNMNGYQNDCVLPILDRCCGAPPSQSPRPFYCCDCTLLPNCSNVKPDFW